MSTVHDTDDPLVQVRQMIADGRQAFARDVDGLLTELRVFSASIGDAIGDVSRDEAIRAMRAFVLEKFDQHLPLGRRSLSEVLLKQLTEENAALRATQVELLDACKRLLTFNEELCADVKVSTHYPSAACARRAIAKAEGADV